MSVGKGSRPRPVNGERYRENHDAIFRKFTEEQPMKGEIIDGHEYLGYGGWHSVDQHDPELRDAQET